MTGESKITTDHDTIRRWAEERGGQPVAVTRAGGNLSTDTDMRIDFLNERWNEEVEKISWEEFFQRFDERNMAMVYQDETEGGRKSRYCKLVRREEVDQAVIE